MCFLMLIITEKSLINIYLSAVNQGSRSDIQIINSSQPRNSFLKYQNHNKNCEYAYLKCA